MDFEDKTYGRNASKYIKESAYWAQNVLECTWRGFQCPKVKARPKAWRRPKANHPVIDTLC